MIAVSDAGFWLTGRIESTEGGHPIGITEARVGPLVAQSGRRLKGAREVDAEAVRLVEGTPDNGAVLISFERIHRIGRFRVGRHGIEGPAHYLKLPAYVRSLHRNRGIESVAQLRAGRYKGATVAFAEGRRDARGHLRGWLIRRGRSQNIFLRAMAGFDITDMAGLPDGGLIVLERRFRWSEGIKMRVRRITAGEIRPGAVMKGKVLFEADHKYNIDNMEGIAVHRTAGGEIILTLISDDNFRFFQRTLLMRFAIAKPGT